MLALIIGTILIVIGITSLYRSILSREFYRKLKDGHLKEYKKITGTVICDAYYAGDTDVIKPVTPIVEYEVNGKKYEAQNAILEVGAELPIGTKVYVWYKKDNPNQAILGTELESHLSRKILGITMLFFGIILILIGF